MITININKFKVFASCAVLTFALASCEYKKVRDADYAGQKIYMPAASVSADEQYGTFNIFSIATPGQVYRYTLDIPQRKFNIPLSVFRSGVNLDGTVKVNISTNADTVSKLVSTAVLPTTELIPTGKYSVDPSVTLGSAQEVAHFNLSLDLNYLLANASKRQSIAVSIASSDVELTPKLHTTVVVVDPVILIPTANFLSSRSGKDVSFTNTSVSGVSYLWNFGDGTTSTKKDPDLKTYASAGTYTVTLTVTGLLGDENKSVKTATITIP